MKAYRRFKKEGIRNASESPLKERRFCAVYKKYLETVNKKYEKIIIVGLSAGAFVTQDIIRLNKDIRD